MGLLDNLLGSQVPGGQTTKSLGMAFLGYLASRTGGQSPQAGSGSAGDGFGGLLDGMVTGSTPKANAAASTGLGALLGQFQQNGFGHVISSWIGDGQNQPIAPHQLRSALGPETVNGFAQQTGLSEQEVLSQLSQGLPTMVDELTPEGRVPSAHEMASGQQSRPIEV